MAEVDMEELIDDLIYAARTGDMEDIGAGDSVWHVHLQHFLRAVIDCHHGNSRLACSPSRRSTCRWNRLQGNHRTHDGCREWVTSMLLLCVADLRFP